MSSSVVVVEVPGGRVAARVRGQGPLALLLPGAGRPARDLDLLAEALAGAGWCAASMDYRGAGQSEGAWAQPSLHAVAADAAALLRQLGGGPALVVGHAFGNRVARCLAEDEPGLVDRLVLLAAGGLVPPKGDPMRVWRLILSRPPGDAERTEAIAEAFFAPGQDPAPWQDWELPSVPHLLLASSATAREDWWSGGDAPMLVVQGLDDATAPPENARALLRDAPHRVDVAWIEGAGHALLPERGEEVVARVLAWLRAPRREAAPTAPPGSSEDLLPQLLARSAEQNAAFVLPHIRPGARVLDLGCGPGTITVGLARASGVPVTALDPDPEMLRRAALAAEAQGVELRAVQATAEALPFPDGCFDLVFAHTVFMHLPRPQRALAECWRVLAPGGRIALVDGDWGCDLVHPTFPPLEAGRPHMIAAARAMGMDPFFGRRHRGLLHQAGFVVEEVSIFTEVIADPESIERFVAWQVGVIERLLARGGVDPGAAQISVAAFRAWAAHPGAMGARSRVQTLARRPA